MHQYSSQVLPHISESDEASPSQTEETSTNEESFSSSDSEKELTDISKLLTVQPSTGSNNPSPFSPPPTPIIEEADSDIILTASRQENYSPKPSNNPWFTFDDIPKVKWPARFQEFFAWIDVQMLKAGAITQTVLKKFSSHFTGSLKDWFESLGPYRQFQVIQAQISEVLGIIYEQFLGEATAANEQTRREFHLMKCCSLQIKIWIFTTRGCLQCITNSMALMIHR